MGIECYQSPNLKPKGPFTLALLGVMVLSYYTAIALCCRIFLHRNCDVTELRCRMKVKFILTWNAVMQQWLAAESNWYIGTATQLRCSVNGPLRCRFIDNFCHNLNRLTAVQVKINLLWHRSAVTPQSPCSECSVAMQGKWMLVWTHLNILYIN